jgi:ferrous iron transport protein B
MWIATTFPNYSESDANKKISTSYAGQIGQAIEPIFHPMGVDWRVGVGLISAFAAREVFVSTLAVTMNITDENEETQQQSLIQQMKTATNSAGQLIFTTGSVVGLIVFFMIALQCMSTFAIIQKETHSKTFAWVQLITFNLVAYMGAVICYQLLG